jgi:hypothetical protein
MTNPYGEGYASEQIVDRAPLISPFDEIPGASIDSWSFVALNYRLNSVEGLWHRVRDAIYFPLETLCWNEL